MAVLHILKALSDPTDMIIEFSLLNAVSVYHSEADQTVYLLYISGFNHQRHILLCSLNST
jgi:hypothetical protein